MTPETVRLRAAIHSGALACACREIRTKRGELGPFFGDYHLAGCQWCAAVLRIYEAERLQEASPRV